VNVTESMETTSPSHPFSRKVRTLAVGALATAALAVPAVSALGVVSHEAGRAPARVQPIRISPDSHRLALTERPASLRLT
jgi:hypothetical protein